MPRQDGQLRAGTAALPTPAQQAQRHRLYLRKFPDSEHLGQQKEQRCAGEAGGWLWGAAPQQPLSPSVRLPGSTPGGCKRVRPLWAGSEPQVTRGERTAAAEGTPRRAGWPRGPQAVSGPSGGGRGCTQRLRYPAAERVPTASRYGVTSPQVSLGTGWRGVGSHRWG